MSWVLAHDMIVSAECFCPMKAAFEKQHALLLLDVDGQSRPGNGFGRTGCHPGDEKAMPRPTGDHETA